MLSMAKNFFHSLGHKSKKGHGFDDSEDAPPSYDSLEIAPLNGNPTELSSASEIVEIDSVEVSTFRATLARPSTPVVIDPQALRVPELDSTTQPAETYMNWHPTSIAPSPSFHVSPAMDSEARGPHLRPVLQVHTDGLRAERVRRQAARAARQAAHSAPRSKDKVTPSSSVRSTASTDSTVSTSSNVSSLISPISNWSGTWSHQSGMNTSLTSPVDAISPSRLLADNPFADDAGMDSLCPGFMPDIYELPAELPTEKGGEELSSDLLMLAFDVPASSDMSYATNVVLAEDSAEIAGVGECEVDESNLCCSETKSMVGSAWDALQEHIVSSMVKIEAVRGNTVADQLRTMSTKTIALTGLRTLRMLLRGVQPSAAVDALCFIHLMYAFSLVVHEQGTSQQSKDLFLQSLSYATTLPFADRDSYTQLVFGIWQPAHITQADISEHFQRAPSASLSRSSSLKGKHREDACDPATLFSDPLLTAASNFLDGMMPQLLQFHIDSAMLTVFLELESSLVLGEPPSAPEVQASDLYTKHLLDFNPDGSTNHAFYVTVNYVLTVLLQDFSDAENLVSKLNDIHQRVRRGALCSVWRVEIELLNAGKVCRVSPTFCMVLINPVCTEQYEPQQVLRLLCAESQTTLRPDI